MKAILSPAGARALNILCVVLSAAGAVLAQNTSTSPTIAAAGQILLKVTPEMQASMSSGGGILSIPSGPSRIAALNAQYGVTGATSVFATSGPGGASAGGWMDVDAIKARYPNRSSRVLPATPAPPDVSRWYTLTMDSSVDPLQACGEYAKDTANVEQCAPNFLAAMLEVYKPDDPLYSSGGSFGQLYLDQWGTRKMRLEHFWNGTRGAGMVVAVVDTGIDMNHPDLADNIWFNTNESLGGGDGDGNGYAQDFHGWNFVDGNNDPTDRNGHGTHVSGILGAAGNNGIGMIGVAPEVAIMPVRALDEKGNGTVSNLAQAIIYAAANGADVINNSWGCKTSCPKNPLVEDAVRFAKALGAEVVFAAGNSGAAIDVPASFRRLAAGSGPMSGCRCPTPCAKNEGSGQFTVFYWPAVLVAGH